jgi:hypothetical protein
VHDVVVPVPAGVSAPRHRYAVAPGPHVASSEGSGKHVDPEPASGSQQYSTVVPLVGLPGSHAGAGLTLYAGVAPPVHAYAVATGEQALDVVSVQPQLERALQATPPSAVRFVEQHHRSVPSGM